jgi:hypothetical protein
LNVDTLLTFLYFKILKPVLSFININYRFIHSKNRAGLGYALKVNHLTDLTNQELKQMRGYRHTGAVSNARPFNKAQFNATSLPQSLDWRLMGRAKKKRSSLVKLKILCMPFSTALKTLVYVMLQNIQLCFARCCDSSKGPGSVWIMLEFWYLRACRGSVLHEDW